MKTTLILAAVCSSAAISWGFHDAMENGTPVASVTSRQSAMGGVWALPSGGPASVFLNPAELSMLDGPTVTGSAAIIEWESSIIGENTLNILDTGTGGAGTLAFGMPLSGRLAAGAGIARVSDFGFNGLCTIMEQVGPGQFQVSSIQLLDAQGSLWEAGGGISAELSDWLTVGVSGTLRFGSGSWDCRNVFVNQSVPDDTLSEAWEVSDPAVHGGVLIPLEFGTFALSGTNATDRYLSRVAFGFQRDFRILDGSTLGFEFDLQDIEDRPSWSGMFSAFLAEMIPSVRSTYSVGFTRPADPNRTALSMGTGARIFLGNVDLDLGISWISRSRTGSLFPEPFVDSVDDAGTYFSVGMNWRL
ncbi:MAG: hypothetical protein AVO35_03135 [Candidatus Aegiribacteria sp. MLS_C]|nr:MAG: hypothetical protein AVO35_03135 [Candidatus Aegiribacteria sp. MLS_C]